MELSTFNQSEHGFCRDCLTQQKSHDKRCYRCGSPRLLRHEELYNLSLAHIDCDAFYASIEKRDDPSLRHQPLIIGGGTRGVVSTACYIARIKGVRSAMPMFKALQLCPNAVVIPPNMDKYRRVSHEIQNLMLELTPLVEPISIDEAFLDLTGTEKLHKAPSAYVLANLVQRIEKKIGITVSVGLSYCKLLAKVASDLDKPKGFSVIGRKEAKSFLAQRPVTTIWGIGKKTAQNLANDGIVTVGQLQQIELSTLLLHYGQLGQRLYSLSRGIDERKVIPKHDSKSVSAETTFQQDFNKREDLVPILRKLAEKVSFRLKQNHLIGHTIVLKLKTQNFQSRTRNRQLKEPTQLADQIFKIGLELLEKELNGSAFRLIGIGVHQLKDFSHVEMLESLIDDNDVKKRAAAESAMDIIRHKFGNTFIETGYTFNNKNKNI
ncbi:DNA polymerase IV [Bartonella tamiae]|uniref:DNA polymerase IV n=1 Tax=Bartonella tamiae Th239 TaxID=1094558 RepID=J1JVU9_9HYPH|nr:DNA polymerase IV [Bartonella tamiae]EJF88690.1 hypothetical protein ME5_01241 [Bartonella tamiae Th239]EJF95060.1 hypothetical protein MEG_00641 [Bartonella tamiae Th307]